MSDNVLAVDLLKRKEIEDASGVKAWNSKLVDELLEQKLKPEDKDEPEATDDSESEEDAPDTQEGDSTTESSDGSDEESPDDTKDTKDSSDTDTTKDDTKDSKALEALYDRLSIEGTYDPLTDDMIMHHVFNGIGKVIGGAVDATKYVGGKAIDGAKYAYDNKENIANGISTTANGVSNVAKFVGNTSLKILTTVVGALDKGQDIIDDYRGKDQKRIQSLLSQVDSQLKLVSTLSNKKPESKFNNHVVITSILTKDGELTPGIIHLKDLVSQTEVALLTNAHISIHSLNASIKQLKDTHEFGSVHTQDKLSMNGLVECSKDNKSTYVNKYCFNKTLPGSRIFSVSLPSIETNDYDTFIEASHHISINLGIENDIKPVTELSYMNKVELVRLLTHCKDILNILKKSVVNVKQLSTERDNLKLGVGSYIKFLAHNKDAAGYDKFNNYLGAKSKVIDKLYIAGGMKVADYVIDTMTRLLDYTHTNIKVMS